MIDLNKVDRWLAKRELKNAQQESAESIEDFRRAKTNEAYGLALTRMRVAFTRQKRAEGVVNGT
ncbi:hypothetical protein LCGC14_2348800 [marine sediment metagenome]|uniref:Uncharacterized protein n=1 Tax=marine sediment metagenome TaxID=412755 RepID=A0A0F9C9N5_9ZZZZ